MNRYLEKIAEINKEAMNTQALAGIARQVGLRREGDWRGIARQFADNKGQLLPARQRAAIRTSWTGISNNSTQQMQAAQRHSRQGDEVMGLVSEKTKNLTRLGIPKEDSRGIVQNPGMGLLDPRIDARDGAARQAVALEGSSNLAELLKKNYGKASFVHTHPLEPSTFKRLSSTGRLQTAANDYGDIAARDIIHRRNLPTSSMGGSSIAASVNTGNILRNKQDAHMMATGIPKVDVSKLKVPDSPEYQEEVSRIMDASKDISDRISPAMNSRLNTQFPGDHSTFPMINRRNSIIGQDRTIGVHSQASVPTHRDDLMPNIPVGYKHHYFDIGQGGHKATRRLVAAGIDPEKYGLNTSFLR